VIDWFLLVPELHTLSELKLPAAPGNVIDWVQVPELQKLSELKLPAAPGNVIDWVQVPELQKLSQLELPAAPGNVIDWLCTGTYLNCRRCLSYNFQRLLAMWLTDCVQVPEMQKLSQLELPAAPGNVIDWLYTGTWTAEAVSTRTSRCSWQCDWLIVYRYLNCRSCLS
jgi:hypothetical protein